MELSERFKKGGRAKKEASKEGESFKKEMSEQAREGRGAMKGGKSAHGESHAKGKADRKKKKRHEYEAKGDKAFGGTNKLNNPHPKKHRKAFPKFKEGGLHKSLGAKPGAKLTAKQHSAAKSGKKGSLAKKQEVFYENMLKHRIGPTPQAREGYRRMAKRINSKGVPKTGAATLMAEMKKQMHRR